MPWTAPTVTRIDEPFVAPERQMLDGWLDWHRTSLLHRCAGLTGEQLALRSVPPSTLSLLGLVRHHTDVERSWVRIGFLGEDIAQLYWREGFPDNDFDDLDPARAAEEYDALVAEQQICRELLVGADLDATLTSPRHGERSLRWMLIHLIEEYAQHNGHADLLRECIDGVTDN